MSWICQNIQEQILLYAFNSLLINFTIQMNLTHFEKYYNL